MSRKISLTYSVGLLIAAVLGAVLFICLSLFLGFGARPLSKTGYQVLGIGAGLIVALLLALILTVRRLIAHPIGTLSSFAASHIGSDDALPTDLLERQDEIGELSRNLQAASIEIREQRLGSEMKLGDHARALQNATVQLDQIGRTDQLTGLYNRQYLKQDALALLALSIRQQDVTAVLSLDLDRFKDLNDAHGHEVGDQALVHIAQILKRSTRPYDLVVRSGGEEFVLVLPLVTDAQSMIIAERIRMAVEKTPLKTIGGPVSMTISIGLYIEAGLRDIEAAVQRANEALAQAKAAGRNRVCKTGAGN